MRGTRTAVNMGSALCVSPSSQDPPESASDPEGWAVAPPTSPEKRGVPEGGDEVPPCPVERGVPEGGTESPLASLVDEAEQGDVLGPQGAGVDDVPRLEVHLGD